MKALDKLLEKEKFSHSDMAELLSLNSKTGVEKLFKKAYDVKTAFVGKTVYFRGIIEMSNICCKNCRYCGIRKDNKNLDRYMMTEKEILDAAKWCHESGYGSVVIQSGERDDPEFADFVTKIVKKIKELSGGELGITLSLGEQSAETYRRWFEAGAHRYLLRIETSNRELYKKLHPDSHRFSDRCRCLDMLREEGYQVGTGVMTGLPGQTAEDLAYDVIFFRNNDIDMIGMGPYIPHVDTPMKDSISDFSKKKKEQLQGALKMIAVTRIVLKDVNIAAATALQALDPVGREMGLEAGANIVMPNVTDTKYRKSYKLYEDKPCTDENSKMCRSCLSMRIGNIGETIGFNKWGDSPHFKKKVH